MFLVIIMCYLIISIFVPIYKKGSLVAPTGPGSELIGIGVEWSYRDIYGIDITSIVDRFLE